MTGRPSNIDWARSKKSMPRSRNTVSRLVSSYSKSIIECSYGCRDTQAVSVVPMNPFHPFVAFLRFNRECGDRPGFQPPQADGLAGFLAIAV